MSLLTGASISAYAQNVGTPVHIKSMDAKTLEEAKKKAESEGKTVEVINQVKPEDVKPQVSADSQQKK